MLDRDLEPYDYGDDWVRADDVADSVEIHKRLGRLIDMIDSDASKADLLLAIDEIYQFLGEV
jgi:hypothetical protein